MEPNELRLFTTPKLFRSTFEHDGSTFEVEVETPDLSGGTVSIWGDWGPTYTFEFDEPRSVRITYRCEALSSEDESEVQVGKLQLDSPMLYARRQEHPLFLRFRDPSRGVEFEGYLDAKGEPAVLEAKQASFDADEFGSPLLWQPPRSRGWHGAAADRMQA